MIIDPSPFPCPMGRVEGLFLSASIASRFGVAWLPFPFRRRVGLTARDGLGYLRSATGLGIHERLAMKKNDAPPVLSMGGACFLPCSDTRSGRYPYTKS